MAKKVGEPVTLERLAQIIGGSVLNSPDGAPQMPAESILISGIAAIAEAVPGQITFLSDAKKIQSHLEELKCSRASAVISHEKVEALSLPSIRVANPYLAFSKALSYFHPETTPPKGIHPTAFVHEDANVDPTASIGPLAVVEADAEIGPLARIDAQVYIGREARVEEGAHLFPHVVIGEGCRVGKRSIIHCGAVVGSDGFGFFKDGGQQKKVPQVGIVDIGSDVEIGANVTIDRATMGKTLIGDGTKIDNLVQIAHNVQLGKGCTIVAQVGISGSTILEDEVTLAGQVGTVGHVRIGKGSIVAARGVVTSDVEPGSIVSGFPLKPHQEEKRILVALRRLPELLKTVRHLEETLKSKGPS